jgi:hypothetical protein
MKTEKIIPATSILFLALLLSSCGPGQLWGPTLTPVPTATSTPTTTLTPMPPPTSTPTSTPTATASPVPAAYQTMNVNEYATFTVYWKRDLWESAASASGNVLTEDFEKDTADYGELSFPYLTGNGFLLSGGEHCPAQIFQDATQLDTGNIFHFRDFECGLTVAFPNDAAASAFGFDYRPSETWQVTVNDAIITIPGGRKGFFGFITHENFPVAFRLSCTETVQGGLSVDNISYISADAP